MDERSTISSRPSTRTAPTFALVALKPTGLSLETFSKASGLHPDLARRLVALGLLDARADAAGELSFPPAQLAVAARIQRLRAGFALNYAAIGVVMDLLDRIARLERDRRRPPTRRTATRNGEPS